MGDNERSSFTGDPSLATTSQPTLEAYQGGIQHPATPLPHIQHTLRIRISTLMPARVPLTRALQQPREGRVHVVQ